MGIIEAIKTSLKLKSFALVLLKVDTVKISDYISDFGEKTFPGKRKDFLDMVYKKLLELLVDINNKRKVV